MLRLPSLLFVVTLAAATSVALAEEPAQEKDPTTQHAAPTTQPSLQTVPDYRGTLWDQLALTGDWGGERNWLVDHGVKFNMQVIQYAQGNAYGGLNPASAFEDSGTADYAIDFDFQRMGLWPGGFARIRGETAFGRPITADVGAISAPNFDALLPAPDQPGLTTLTEYWMMQFVSEKLGFIAGQVDLTGLPGQNVFA
ncbi:MAG: hypothetical protein P8099_20950, partial [Gemmatimonadota bacterium]